MLRTELLEREIYRCRHSLNAGAVMSWQRLEYLIGRERQLAERLDRLLIDLAIDNLQPTPYEVTT